MGKKNLPKIYTSNYDLNKRWFIEYRDENGKRVMKYGNINRFKTRAERLQAAKAIIKEILETLEERTETIEYLYMIEKKLLENKNVWRKKTHQGYNSKFTIFRSYVKNRELTKELMHGFFFDFLTEEKRLNPTTYNHYVQTIAFFMEWIGKKHLMADIKKRKANPTPAAYYTRSQKKYLINAIEEESQDLFLFVQFIYYCFLRPGQELRLLKVGDIILEDKKIVVSGNISKNKKQQYISIPDVFFPRVLEFIDGKNPNAYLFEGSRSGEPMAATFMPRMHRKILKKLHFDTKRYKLYSWKHTGVVAVAKAGIHIKQLQIQLRHHSLDQVDMYLRQLGVHDLDDLKSNFPSI